MFRLRSFLTLKQMAIRPSLNFFKWILLGKRASWPEWVDNKSTPSLKENLSDDEIAITFINHSTFLIQLKGINILTDPVFSERVSPLSFIGPKRVRAPGLPFNQLPRVDLVIISHNHYDHMDFATIKKLNKKFSPQFLILLGDGDKLKKLGVENYLEMDWWSSTTYKRKKLKITFTPAQHFSGRGLFDRNECLWGGYVLSFNNFHLFFAGDTGYASHFKEIKNRFGPMDFSLLPIGAYKPQHLMRTMHTPPGEAVQAHLDLASKKSIGMHFGTFQLTDEYINLPEDDLEQAKIQRNINPNDFHVLEVGQTLYHSLAL